MLINTRVEWIPMHDDSDMGDEMKRMSVDVMATNCLWLDLLVRGEDTVTWGERRGRWGTKPIIGQNWTHTARAQDDTGHVYDSGQLFTAA